ncbi:MAG: MFS transporter [Streptosporangiales bacterium]|nr:MFS transporter [Streptosporangiales bacterium]
MTTTPRREPRAWLSVAGIVVIALNMRASLAASSPLLPDIRDDLGLSASVASLLTTLPLLCFGVLATAAVAAGLHLGSERVLLLAMVGVAAGSALRAVPAALWLLLGTVVIGAAITAGNVLVPVVVKQYFPRDASVVTGLYTAALVGGAALTSGISAPLAHDTALGWQGVLLVMGVPALLAALVWAPQLRRRHLPPTVGAVRVLRDKITWALAAFMGMQSLMFFATLTWLPTLLHDAGVSVAKAGIALAVFNLVGVGSSLVVPSLVSRRPSQVPAVLALCVTWAVAYAGLYVAPSLYLVWSVVSGVAQGAGISLALTLIVLRARTPEVARSLSGTVQGIGYLMAATGPLVVGALRDVTGGWTAPFVALGLAVAVMAATSPWSAGARQVG